MKKLILSLFGMMALSSVAAQSLEKMNWFNEPEKWEIKDSKTMTMFVTLGVYHTTVLLLTMLLSTMLRMVVSLKQK